MKSDFCDPKKCEEPKSEMCSDENNDPDCGKLKTDYCDEECTAEVQAESVVTASQMLSLYCNDLCIDLKSDYCDDTCTQLKSNFCDDKCQQPTSDYCGDCETERCQDNSCPSAYCNNQCH